jgi:hypothetical protein
MNTRRFLVRQVMLLALIIGIVACAQTSPAQTSATPTVVNSRPTSTATLPSPTPTPPFLGPMPQDCLPGPTPQRVFPDVGPALGQAPVWAIGFDGPHANIRISTSFTYTQYGWTWKILWRISDSSPGPITLQAVPLRNGPLLWFQIGDQNPTTSPILVPVTPDPSYLTVTNAAPHRTAKTLDT